MGKLWMYQKSCMYVLFRMVFSGVLTEYERGPMIIKLDIVIPYQKKIQKVYKSCD